MIFFYNTSMYNIHTVYITFNNVIESMYIAATSMLTNDTLYTILSFNDL